VIEDIRRSSVVTLVCIAGYSKAVGVKIPAGCSTWQPVQVARMMAAAWMLQPLSVHLSAISEWAALQSGIHPAGLTKPRRSGDGFACRAAMSVEVATGP
jgi:hypothetical protein